ncbi:MAG: NnrU family protein [Gammaproteobacteria bacterium]|nr:NnrU family protein [Gammaproteobacteria bacterium]
MSDLIVGLVVFLGTHSLRMVADGWRGGMLERFGKNAWKALYSLVSLLGLALIVWGFERARAAPVALYAPPVWLRHLNALFTLLAFVLLAAAYVPRNRLKARIGHPMLAGVALWALGHLLATGNLRDVVLFGAFFVWAAADFALSRRRDRRAGVTYPLESMTGNTLSLVIGLVGWIVFALWLHRILIGVDPLL